MLLQRWHKTLADFRDAPALFLKQRIWSFADLAAALRLLPPATSPVPACGGPLEIVLASLRGWRDGQAVIPAENLATLPPSLRPPGAKIAHVKLTPGIDGHPRGIWFTAEQMGADADRLVAAMGLSPDMPNLAALSLTQSYGYSSLVLPLLLHGIPLICVDLPFPALIVEAWKPHRQVVVPAAPSLWRAWHRSGILEHAPIALAISAGAPLALDLEQELWDSLRLKIHNFYGASECGGISYDDSPTPRVKESDLGTPLPGVHVALQAGDRFLISSNAVAEGYDEPRDGEQLGNSLFLSSDHGHLTDGHLHLHHHGGRFINVAGRKIGPGRVESALLATGLIEKVRVFGLPSADPERVEEVAALVPPKSDIPNLRRVAGTLMATWEMPRHWISGTSPADFRLSRRELTERYAPKHAPLTAGRRGGRD